MRRLARRSQSLIGDRAGHDDVTSTPRLAVRISARLNALSGRKYGVADADAAPVAPSIRV